MRESRILAVSDVEMQAHRGRGAALEWFYVEVIGLDPVSRPGEGVCFRSADVELRYALLEEPEVESSAHRATFLVDSLTDTRQAFEEAGHAYMLLRGMAYTDRWLSLLDPGGNRVALRQRWRRY
ncbi:MAG: VOC family protein [bacterium]|nr:VOC family protein [bacterium]